MTADADAGCVPAPEYPCVGCGTPLPNWGTLCAACTAAIAAAARPPVEEPDDAAALRRQDEARGVMPDGRVCDLCGAPALPNSLQCARCDRELRATFGWPTNPGAVPTPDAEGHRGYHYRPTR